MSPRIQAATQLMTQSNPWKVCILFPLEILTSKIKGALKESEWWWCQRGPEHSAQAKGLNDHGHWKALCMTRISSVLLTRYICKEFRLFITAPRAFKHWRATLLSYLYWSLGWSLLSSPWNGILRQSQRRLPKVWRDEERHGLQEQCIMAYACPVVNMRAVHRR